jgi:hypothetical protein
MSGLTGYHRDIAEFPELADIVPFSADWYRRWRDLRLAKYPDVDQGTRDNLDMFVEQAEKREAAEHSAAESPIEGANPMMDVEARGCPTPKPDCREPVSGGSRGRAARALLTGPTSQEGCRQMSFDGCRDDRREDPADGTTHRLSRGEPVVPVIVRGGWL